MPGHVIMVQEEDTLPAEAQFRGTIKFNSEVFAPYEEVQEEIRVRSLALGGNIVQQILLDRRQSGAYHFIGDVYELRNLAPLVEAAIRKDDSISKLLVPEGADYALLYVYRPGAVGMLVGYNLFIADSFLCRVKAVGINEIKLYREGEVTLWGKTESARSVKLKLEKGKAYFLRCGVTWGVVVGKPELIQVSNAKGLHEVRLMRREIKPQKKKRPMKDDLY